jgi:hypothetical protein
MRTKKNDFTPEQYARHLQNCKKWRDNNPDKIRAYRQTHKKKRRAQWNAWRAKNRDRCNFRRTLSYYGITEQEYNAALERQGGLCGICKERCRLVVDHCHDTDKFRGLLCNSCNVAIGYLRNDPERLSAAIEYLQNFNPSVA